MKKTPPRPEPAMFQKYILWMRLLRVMNAVPMNRALQKNGME